MFTMMNEARIGVGVQGLAVADPAYQHALAYARERVQGKTRQRPGAERSDHPPPRRPPHADEHESRDRGDACAGLRRRSDASTTHRHPDGGGAQAQARVDLLIPIVKAWFTDPGTEIASTGVQIHGGIGFIEETGAAQHLRDARIPIYEGTTGIQANDLVGRKVLREGGRSIHALIGQMDRLGEALARASGPDLPTIGARLEGTRAMADAVDWILATGTNDINAVLAGAVPFLHLCGVVCGGWQLARAAQVAQRKLDSGDGNSAFYKAKIATARFYSDQELSRARGLAEATIHAAASTMALAESDF